MTNTEEQKTLYELHKGLLELLCEFDRICRKYDIKYTLAFGTLLGAVRHGGFIPWDDDVDIIMRRKDYERFCSIAPSQIAEGFFVQNIDTEKSYQFNTTRLRKNNTAMVYKQWRGAGFHQGIYIDINPCDVIPNNKRKRLFQKLLIVAMTPVRASRNKFIFFNSNSIPIKNKFVKSLIYYILRCCPEKICRKIENNAIRKYNTREEAYTGIICEGGVLLNMPADMRPFKRAYLEKYVELEFEGHMFWVSAYYKELLKGWYGDYMQLPPVEERRIYHQPIILDLNKDYTEYL